MRSISVVPSCVLALGRCVVLAVGLGFLACQPSEQAAPEPRASTEVSAPGVSAPFDVMSVVRRAERAFRAKGTGFTSEQPTYAVAVDARGKVAFRPGGSARLAAGDAPELVLETVGWGRGRVVALAVGGVEALEDGGLALDRGLVRETLRNGEKGTEQAWEVDHKPEGEGPLAVRVRVTGQRFVQASSDGLHFAPESGEGPGVRYGLATWVDARGTRTPLPAPRHEKGEVVLEVPASVLESSVYPAVLDPLISPEVDLGVELPTPMEGWQVAPQVAFDGTNYLVVWQHSQRPNDISGARWTLRASRVSRTGEVLDVGGFVVSSDEVSVSADEAQPALAFNGTNYLVVWPRVTAIRATRITPAGVVLDPAGITVFSSGAGRGAPAVASDGQDFLVAWRDANVGGYPPGRTGVLARRVTGAGQLLDGTGLWLSMSVDPGAQPALTFVAGNYVALWEGVASGTTRTLMGRTVSPQGVMGTAFTVTSSTVDKPSRPVAASYGTGLFAAWEQVGTSSVAMFGVRLSPLGVRQDAQNLLLGGRITSVAQRLAAAFDGVNVHVAWVEEAQLTTTPRAGLIRVSPVTGQVVGAWSGVVLGNATSGGSPSLAWDGERMLVAWPLAHLGQDDIRGTFVSSAGVVQDSPPRFLSMTVNSQSSPQVAFDGEVYLVVWSEWQGGDGLRIHGARIHRDGTVLDPAGFPISPGGGRHGAPRMVAGTSGFFVIWEDFLSTQARVQGARVQRDGTVLDTSGLRLSVGFTNELVEPRVAANGQDFLVVWSQFSSEGTSRAVFVRDGVVGTPWPLPVGNTNAIRDVVLVGQRYLVTWTAAVNGRESLLGSWLTTEGAWVANSTQVLGSSAKSFVSSAVGVGAQGVLAVWPDSTSRQVQAVRMSESGVVLDAAPIVVGSYPAGSLAFHADTFKVTFDGANYLVVWNLSGATASQSGLRGYRVSPEGQVLAGANFSITEGMRYVGGTVASDGEGRSLVAYAPQTAQLVKLRWVESLPRGRACTANDACASGFCVDGVCCSSACGGGEVGDCQSCAVARGGAEDGTCGPVVDVSTVCRGSAGACDVPERCDGASMECPADAPAPEGTACDDGSACTEQDVCRQGHCVGEAPRVCTAPNPCMKTGVCDPATGTCSPPEPVADGTACDDGNACTRSDTCQAGACLGADPVTCAASEACHAQGTCQPATGICSSPAFEDGTECAGGTCQSGACVPAWDAGTELDAGTGDAGESSDAGGVTDAGTDDAGSDSDAGGAVDAGADDAGGAVDAGSDDAGGAVDAGSDDAGGVVDAGSDDAGSDSDAGGGSDAGEHDAGGVADAGVSDAGGVTDAGVGDAGSGSDAGGASDAGTEVSGESDAGAADAGGGSSDAGNGAEETIPPKDGATEEERSFGCSAPSGASIPSAWLLLAGAALVSASRRRRA